jgi:hypothetical protein
MKGELPQMIKNFKVGICAEPNEIKDIENGFKYFLECPKLELDLMGVSAKTLLSNNFLRENNIRKLTVLTFENA